jgi:serine/threonine protein kinase
MQSTQGSLNSSTIAAGTRVGGRFMIEATEGDPPKDALGIVLQARDEKTNKLIAVRVLSSAFAGDPQAFEAIRTEVRAAAKLKHRSLVGTYGIGTHDHHHFVACEWVQGIPLSDFMARRRQSGTQLSLRGAYNVVAHMTKALTQVHTTGCHGALRPSVVWVTTSGRVKIGELGLSLALANSGQWRLLEPTEQAFLAPEVRAGGSAGPSSDVYGVGALFYALLVGDAPGAAYVPVSQVRDDVSTELDDTIASCLAADPAQRFAHVQDIGQALLHLVAGTPEPEHDEFGVDLEIDVDIAASVFPPAPAPARKIPPPAASRGSSPNNGAAARSRDPFAAGAAPRAPSTPGGERAVQPKAAPAEISLAELTAKLTENDAPRWIAVKDGLDHGPFTARELIKLIVEGQILDKHVLLNMSSNDKKPLGDWPEFHEFVQQYKLHKADADHAVALEKSTRIERGGNAAKFAILGVSLAVLVIAGGGYMMSRQAARKRAADHNTDLAAMFEGGKVKISGTAGILQAGPRRGGGGPRRAGGNTVSDNGGGFASYEDAMNVAMDLGNASKAGDERQLRPSDIEGVMNRKLNSLFGCVSQELRGGGHLGTIRMDLVILGSGQVMGASINMGSASFKQCLVGKLRQIHFPSFPAPRMGARYSFGVD